MAKKKKAASKQRKAGGMDWVPWALGGAALVGGILLLTRRSSASSLPAQTVPTPATVQRPPTRPAAPRTETHSDAMPADVIAAVSESQRALRAFALQAGLYQLGFTDRKPSAARIRYMAQNDRYDDETARAVSAMGGSVPDPALWDGPAYPVTVNDMLLLRQWLNNSGNQLKLPYSSGPESLVTRLRAIPELA